MSTLAIAFICAWTLTAAYLAWLGKKQLVLKRRLDDLEAAAKSDVNSTRIERTKVA